MQPTTNAKKNVPRKSMGSAAEVVAAKEKQHAEAEAAKRAEQEKKSLEKEQEAKLKTQQHAADKARLEQIETEKMQRELDQYTTRLGNVVSSSSGEEEEEMDAPHKSSKVVRTSTTTKARTEDDTTSKPQKKQRKTTSSREGDKTKPTKDTSAGGGGQRKKLKSHHVELQERESGFGNWEQDLTGTTTFDDIANDITWNRNPRLFHVFPEFPSYIDRTQLPPGKLMEMLKQNREVYFDVSFPTGLPWATVKHKKKEVVATASSSTSVSAAPPPSTDEVAETTWVHCGQFCRNDEGICWIDIPGDHDDSHRLYLDVFPKSTTSSGLVAAVRQSNGEVVKAVIENQNVFQAQLVPNWLAHLENRAKNQTDKVIELSTSEAAALHPFRGMSRNEISALYNAHPHELVLEADRMALALIKEKKRASRRAQGDDSSSSNEDDDDGDFGSDV